MTRLLTKNLNIVITICLLGWATVQGYSQTAQVSFLESFSYGDTFHVDIYIDSIQNMGAYTASVKFDTSKFTLLDIVDKTNMTGGTFGYNNLDSQYIFAWFNLAPLTQPDTVARITLVRKQFFCNDSLYWTGSLRVGDELGQELPSKFNNGVVYFLTDEKPAQYYPTPNANTVPVNSIFRWQGSGIDCPKGYHLQVATDTFFTQMVTDTIVSDSAFGVGGMQELTMHYWRVAKVDELDNEYWSPTQTFATTTADTIINKIPTISAWEDTVQVPITFFNDQNIQKFNLTINYDTATFDYIGYQNLIDTLQNILVFDNNVGRVQLFWQSSDYAFIIPSDTLINLTFVKKAECFGQITWDSTSQYLFSENVAIPSVFENGSITFLDSLNTQLSFPEDTSINVFIRPEIVWHSVECTDGYRLQISQDSNFTMLVLDSLVLDTLATVTVLQGDSTYFWRVGRQNAVDSLYWSSTWEFTTEPVLAVSLAAKDLATSLDSFYIPLVLDSLENAIAFQLDMQYDTSAIAFLGVADATTLINGMAIQANNGMITILWESEDSSLATVANILSDTLLQLHFKYLDGCQTTVNWDVVNSDFYHINSNINIDVAFKNSTITFLKNIKAELLTPFDSTAVSSYPDLTWSQVECAVDYRLLIAVDSNFTQITIDTTVTDTTFWATQLAPNTTYYWRVDKRDLLGDYLGSDTLLFTTGSGYTTSFKLDSILTYQDTTNLIVTVDSILFLNGFQVELNYNPTEMNFLGITDTLLNNIQVQDNAGMITLSWSDSVWIDIIQDTLLQLQFEYIGTCVSPVTWSNITLNYRENVPLPIPITTKDGHIEFLNTNSPIIVNPSPQQTDVEPTVDFQWQAVDCSVNYQIQVAEDSNFVNILLDSIITADFLNNIVLAHTSTYYWRVGRWDSQSDLYWSDTASFSTINLPPILVRAGDTTTYADTLSVPIIVDTLIKIQSFELALNYDVFAMQFLNYTDTLFEVEVVESSGDILIKWKTDNLNEVLSLDSDTLLWLHFTPSQDCYADLTWDTTKTKFVYEDSTALITLKTTDGSLYWINNNPPQLTFPANDTMFMTPTFQIQWEEEICAEEYRLQLSKEEDFSTIFLDFPNITINSYGLLGLINNEKYYWRVGQVDALGEIHWSEIWNFQIDRTDFQTYRVYPNPVRDKLNIWFQEYNTNTANITIYNTAGQLMQTHIIDEAGKQITIDLTGLQRGLYVISYNDGVSSWTEKIVIL